MAKLKPSAQFRAQKCNLFATYDSVDTIIRDIPNGAPTALVVGITLNTVLELLAVEYEEKGL